MFKICFFFDIIILNDRGGYMQNAIFFSIVSLVYSIVLVLFFFSKKRMESDENKIFKRMLIINLIGLLIEVFPATFAIRCLLKTNIPLAINVLKLILVYFIIWIGEFTKYIFLITLKDKRKYQNKINSYSKPVNIISVIIYIISSFIVYKLPLNAYQNNGAAYTYGPAATYIYLLSAILIILWVIVLASNFKKLRNKKYIPIFAFIIIGVVVIVIQSIYPELTLMLSMQTLIMYLMYFTIENPDIKVIGELNKNKDILEKNNENRSNFLFRMTQEVRKPVSNIFNLANLIDTKNEYVKLDDIVTAIKTNTRHISYVVNNVLDVSDIDIRKIKMMDSKYNAKRLFDEINLFIKDKIPLDVTYNYNISPEMPAMLYGDYIKLKQAIMSILINSLENTKKGFISLDVNVIIKYDMCRLIITVEDSGCGMNIQQVNDILTLDKQLDKEDEKKLTEMDVDLNITKKIINLIGGSIMIKSEIDKGTEFMVVVDQKIVENNDKNIKSFNDTKKVLIVDDDLHLLQNEKNILEEHKINVISTMYGEDAVDKIRINEHFDLILIDDDMVKQSGVATLQQLQTLSNFNTPVIVMLEKNKEIIKKHYIEKGFTDYVLKSDLQNELNRIADKYLK